MWDEENRIRTLSDNGRTQSYIYDANGERVIKRGRQGETAYINGYFVVRNGAVASKHVFNGSQRIATKLVMQESTTIPDPNGNGGSDNNGVGNGNVPPGWIRHGKTSNPGANFPSAQERAQQLQSATPYGSSGNIIYEHQQYFYHPDHVGSTGFVTDANGAVYEHLQYFAFGETWVQERSNIERTPYLFTGKELDEETQLYYFGARYYDPRTSQWQSTDPILEKYLGSDPSKLTNGGAFNSSNFGLYTYSYNNPINLYDPDGHAPSIGKIGRGLVDEASKMSARVIRNARARAVAAAWKEERQLVMSGHPGTRDWTPDQMKELIEKGKVEGFKGHHINNVKDHPELAGNADNIEFLTAAEHDLKHKAAGGYQSPTEGSLVDRTAGGALPKLTDTDGYTLKEKVTNGISTGLGRIGEGLETFERKMPSTSGLINSAMCITDAACLGEKSYQANPDPLLAPAFGQEKQYD